jgi:hypothetical protein
MQAGEEHARLLIDCLKMHRIGRRCESPRARC